MACPAGFTFDPISQKSRKGEIQPGTPVSFYDQTVIWTEKHLSVSQLEPLRRLGDKLADEALEVLKIKPGQDAYKALLEYVARPEHEQESPAPRLLVEQLTTVPDWVDWEQVRRGQQVMWKYIYFISHVLLHFSLVGGFSAPKITKVLTSTGYLVGSKTKERLYETVQFILDISHSLEYLQPRTGRGWESIVQVRFLHAGVRSRLSKIGRAHSKFYNVEEYGVPINQEDLLVTLFSFSSTTWRVLESRMNISLSQQEREDYLHLWRYVGYVMGVDDVLGGMESPEMADIYLDSIVVHLVEPDEVSGKYSTELLKSVSAKPKLVTKIIHALRLPDPFKLHLVMSEGLLGTGFWEKNGLSSMSSQLYWFLRKMIICAMVFELRLTSLLPKFLVQMRLLIIRTMYYSRVERILGKSRTQFELKELPKIQETTLVEKPLEDPTLMDRLWPAVLTAASIAIGVGYLRLM
ncbi:hypothetical protein B0O80DRAFT_526551 [Mortierella sp. GBAus27b]|nr:hypothetical protein B0O80DRAFT_526551 [Mortierella sp. GBAus27b]